MQLYLPVVLQWRRVIKSLCWKLIFVCARWDGPLLTVICRSTRVEINTTQINCQLINQSPHRQLLFFSLLLSALVLTYLIDFECRKWGEFRVCTEKKSHSRILVKTLIGFFQKSKLNQIFFWYRHEYLLVCMFWNNFFLYLIMMSSSKIFFFPAQARAHFKQGQSPIWKKRIFCMHGVHRISDSFRILLTNKTFKFINAYQGWQQNQPDPAALHFTVLAVCVRSIQGGTLWYRGC